MSDLSELMMSPYPGLTKATSDHLRFAAAAAELQVFATNNTESDGGSIRLRNIEPAVAAGPGLYMEGHNSSLAATEVGAITAKWLDPTAGDETSIMAFRVLQLGGTLDMYLNGDTAALYPGAAGLISLGTSALPWNEMWVGNGTRFIRLTHTGPSGISSFVSDNNGFVFYVDSSAIMSMTPTHMAVGPSIGFGSSASLSVGGLAAGVDSYGVASGPAGGGKTSITAFVVSMDLGLVGNRTNVTEYVGGAYASGVATATNHHVFRTGVPTTFVATNRYGFYGEIASAAGAFNLYMVGTAPNLLIGNTGIGGAAGVATYQLEVAASTAITPIARFRNSHGTPTADVVTITSGGDGTGHYLLRAFDSGGTINRLAVRGDGAVFLNTATQTDTSLINLNGRVSLIANQTHDLSATVMATTLVVSTAITVADGKQNDIFRIAPTTVGLAGTAVANAATLFLNVNSSGASCVARAVNAVVVSTGDGFAYGALIRALGSGGHSGTLYGASISTTATGTTSAAIVLLLAHQSTAAYGVLIQATIAGDSLGAGVYVDSSNLVTSFAYAYNQRAGSTADFLTYIDSSAVQRFRVNSSGDIVFAGTGRRIQAATSSATAADNLSLQTTSSNSATFVNIMPSGSGNNSHLLVAAGSDPNNANHVQVGCTTTVTYINASKNGTGVTQPMSLMIDGTYALQLATNRDVLLGPSGAVTTMTAGYPYMPAVAGVPTGVPTVRAGYVPYVYDTTNDFLYVYRGGWKKNTVFA